LSACQKADGTVFWGGKRVKVDGIYATRDHINVRSVLRNKKKLLKVIQNKRRGMLTSGVVFLCDNARPHTSTAARARALLKHFNWELFDQPPYSRDLASSDYNLFTYLENWLLSQHFNNNEKLMEGVKTSQSRQVADFFDTGIKKLISR
jgi:transposase